MVRSDQAVSPNRWNRPLETSGYVRPLQVSTAISRCRDPAIGARWCPSVTRNRCQRQPNFQSICQLRSSHMRPAAPHRWVLSGSSSCYLLSLKLHDIPRPLNGAIRALRPHQTHSFDPFCFF